jgi:hypothetical protein
MVPSFTKATPILSFGAKAPYRWRLHGYLAWPALAYQVVAPEPRPRRQLDLLQKHVLSLVRAGVRLPERIADLLGMDGHEVDLATLMLSKLRQTGLLGDDDQLTHLGRRVLEEESAAQPQLVTGYVFQDPWKQGNFWPRFVPQINNRGAEVVDYEGPRPRLNLGTDGKPFRTLAFVMRPVAADVVLTTPEPIDILRAVRLHHRHRLDFQAERRHRKGAAEGQLPADASELDRLDRTLAEEAGSAPLLNKLAHINEDPKAVYLLTYLFVPETYEKGTDWQVCDPFGLGLSERLRDAIDERRREYEPLNAYLASLFKRGGDDKDKAARQDVADRYRQAEQAVEEKLTLAIRHRDDLFRRLVAMQELAAEAETLGASHPGSRDKAEDLLNRIGKVLEQLFKDLARKHAPGACWEGQGLLPENKGSNAERLSRIAERMGFDLEVRTQDGQEVRRLPDNLARRTLSDIMNTARYLDKAVNQVVVVVLLTADRLPEHPLRAAGASFPRLLLEVAEIAKERNTKGAHAGDEVVSLDVVLGYVRTVYRVTALLTGDGSTATPVPEVPLP